MRREKLGAWVAAVVLGFGILATSAAVAESQKMDPGPYHRVVMKGDLLEVGDDGIFLCIGKRDGATAGQQIDVFRYTRDKSVNPKQGVRFARERVGRIEVTEVVDVHYARAKAIEGKLKVGDSAELEENGN
jgi:hypothetical protein